MITRLIKAFATSLSWKSFFQEQVKFVKLGIWFEFYNASNKDTSFFYSPGTQNPLKNTTAPSKFLADYSPLLFLEKPPGFKPSGGLLLRGVTMVECGPIRFLREDFKPHLTLPWGKPMEVYLLIRDDVETKWNLMA